MSANIPYQASLKAGEMLCKARRCQVSSVAISFVYLMLSSVLRLFSQGCPKISAGLGF